jgi:hypothetical protein
MKPRDAGSPSNSVDQRRRTRNPFGVMDVPNPNDKELLELAIGAKLAAASDDENAKAWTAPANAIDIARSKEIGPVGELAQRTSRFGEMRRTNGNRAKPK